MSENRKYNLPLAELIDKVTINQIKQVKQKNDDNFKDEISKICHDINCIIQKKKVKTRRRHIIIHYNNCSN